MKCAFLLVLVGLILAPADGRPLAAQNGTGPYGPAFSVTWLVPVVGDAASGTLTPAAAHPSFRATVGVAIPGAELYLGGLHHQAYGGYQGGPWPTESPFAVEGLSHRFDAGVAGARFRVLDEWIRLAPYLEVGVGWIEVSRPVPPREVAMELPMATGWVYPHREPLIEQTGGWARSGGGGLTAELVLGAGFGLGMSAGVANVQPSSGALREELGDPRLYHAGAMLSWSPPVPRRSRRDPAARPPRHRPDQPVPDEEEVIYRPGRIVVVAAPPPAAPDSAAADAVPPFPLFQSIRVQGEEVPEAAIVAALAGEYDPLADLLEAKAGTSDPAELDDPLAPELARTLVVEVMFWTPRPAEMLKLLPGVERRDVYTVRITGSSAEEALDFLEFVFDYTRPKR